MNKKLSILIVDDHPGMCASLKDILEIDEHKVKIVCPKSKILLFNGN